MAINDWGCLYFGHNTTKKHKKILKDILFGFIANYSLSQFNALKRKLKEDPF